MQGVLHKPADKQSEVSTGRRERSRTLIACYLLYRAEFAAYDLVLSGIFFDGLRRLHFHEENAKVNADNFTKHLLPKTGGGLSTRVSAGYGATLMER